MICSRVRLLIGLAALSSVARADTSMSYFSTDGPAGDPITHLGWGLGIVSLVVIGIIVVLVVAASLRRRGSSADIATRTLAVQRDGGGLVWIYVGVGLSAIVLIIFMGWTLMTTAAVMRPAAAPTVTIQVSASQWWWGLRYGNADAGQIFTTANEIHIPVGQPVRFELTSQDVIHSFWVPKLGGKRDVIPGQTNVTWLQADRPGVYRGQCAVFCGAEHARMALQVFADSPSDYAAWRDHQLSASPAPTSAAAQRGEQVFEARCGACHTVRGTTAAGLVGPDLTHLMTRRTLAAGMLPNTPGNLAGWIADAQAVKPGSRMPSLMLSGPELASVMAYLETLK